MLAYWVPPFAWQRNSATLSSSSITLSVYFCSISVHRDFGNTWESGNSVETVTEGRRCDKSHRSSESLLLNTLSIVIAITTQITIFPSYLFLFLQVPLGDCIEKINEVYLLKIMFGP